MTALTVTTLAIGTKPLPPSRAQRGLRGAFMNIPYVGPSRIDDGSSGADHATGIETGTTVGGGGAITTDGARQNDTFGIQKLVGSAGGEIEDCGLSSEDGTTRTMSQAPARPANARWAHATHFTSVTPSGFISKGVPGGSTVGSPIDTTGRAVRTGVDRFGRTRGTANSGAGLGTYKYTNFDGGASTSGSGVALGDTVKTTSTGTNQPDSIQGDTVALASKAVGAPRAAPGAGSTTAATVTPTLNAPLFNTTASAAGTISFTDGGSGTMLVDLHDDDQGSEGSNDRSGIVAAVYKPVTDDAQDDGPLVKFASVDLAAGSGTIGTFSTGLATGTYRIYARYRAERPAAAGGGFVYGPVGISTIAIA